MSRLLAKDAGSIQTAESSLDSMAIRRNIRNDLLNIALTFIVLLTIASLASIIILFIFPQWLSIELISKFSDSTTKVAVLTRQDLWQQTGYSKVLTSIKFYIGLWDFRVSKLNTILNSNSVNISIESAPNEAIVISWQNSFDKNRAYATEFTNYINLNNLDILAVQILMILHFIFTFFALCLIFILFCFCSKYPKKLRTSSFVISYFISVIAFFTGLAVLIIISVWKTRDDGVSADNANKLKITFEWCYWLFVGELSSLFVASLLNFIYVITLVVIVSKRKKVEKKFSSMSNRQSQLQLQANAQAQEAQNEPEVPEYVNEVMTKSGGFIDNRQNYNMAADQELRFPRPSRLFNKSSQLNNKDEDENVFPSAPEGDAYVYYNGNFSYKNRTNN